MGYQGQHRARRAIVRGRPWIRYRPILRSYRRRHRASSRIGVTVGLILLGLAVLVPVAADQLVPTGARGPAAHPKVPAGAQSVAPGARTPTAERHRDPVREFDLVATGDILIHTALWEQALAAGHGDGYDFRPMFRDIRPLLRRAALAICHLETPLGDGPPSSYPAFNTPTDLAEAIRWAGWDVCSTASNHSLDRGQDGVDATAAALDSAGVRHAGSYRSARDAGRIVMLETNGVRIAFLAYTSWMNGIPSPNPWTVNLISVPRIEADARKARARGADLVIANFHWGTEYRHETNEEQSVVAHDLLERHVVDLVIGQHVHVVQPIERIAGLFAVYGEGNLVSGMTRLESRDGLMAVIHVRASDSRVAITGVDYIPTWVAHPGYVIEPAASRLSELAASGQGDGALATELRASIERTVGIVGQTGRIHPIDTVSRGRGAPIPGTEPDGIARI